MGRFGVGIELNKEYFRDGVGLLAKRRRKKENMPTLFDYLEMEAGKITCWEAIEREQKKKRVRRFIRRARWESVATCAMTREGHKKQHI